MVNFITSLITCVVYVSHFPRSGPAVCCVGEPWQPPWISWPCAESIKERNPSFYHGLCGNSSSISRYFLKDFFRYLLEVLTFVAVVLVSLVYTETFFLLPLLVKTALTIFTWISVNKVFRNSFGSFYTKSAENHSMS